MEKQYQHTVNGQGVYQANLNAMSEAGALADDRVLAELFKLEGLQKAIIPTGADVALLGCGVVRPDLGCVSVRPFRAMLGPTADEATNPVESYRGERSSICVGASAQSTVLTIEPNSGAGRWDLIYATICPDHTLATETVKVKSPSSGAVSSQSVSLYKSTSVTVTCLKGTSGTGDLPVLPADFGGAYHIALAYVRVSAGFAASTMLDSSDIWDVAPSIMLHNSTGGVSIRPASCQFTQNGGKVGRQTYGFVAGARPPTFMPPTMSGGSSRLIAIDLASAAVSHENGDIVDDSEPWNNRLFKYTVFARASSDTPVFAWEASLGADPKTVPSATSGATGTTMALGMGQTCHTDSTSGASRSIVLHLDSTKLSVLGAGNEISLYMLPGETSLRVGIVGTPAVKLFVWLEASGQFTNR